MKNISMTSGTDMMSTDQRPMRVTARTPARFLGVAPRMCAIIGRSRTGSDQPAEEEHGVAERGAGKRGLADVTQHEHVGGHDRHLRELRDNQRTGELHQLDDFGDPRVSAVALDEGSGFDGIEFGNI